MNAVGFHIFETAIGWCGLAWGPGGLKGATLPGPTPETIRAWARWRFPGAPEVEATPAMRRAAEGVAALMRGEADGLLDVEIDYDGVADLPRRVYEAARAIPPGQTLTYGEVAAKIGEPPQVAQAVGQALGKNPYAPIVPCHRVLGAGGRLVGFSASGGTATKLKLLEIEGATRASSLPLFAGLD